MKRRHFMRLFPVVFGVTWLGMTGQAKAIERITAGTKTMKVYSVEKQGYIETEPIIKSEEEWRQILSPEAFKVLRKQGTERAFSGQYYETKEAGIYRCAACDLDLYLSSAKYDSHSGWPSFYEPVAPENIRIREDRSFFMTRNELVCSRCDSHLGHVFGDGPEPMGERHCINSVSLTFVKG